MPPITTPISTSIPSGPRLAAKALICRDKTVLVQHKIYEDGLERFTLPGGGVNLDETLDEALTRECKEEMGASIEILGLLYVADFLKAKRTAPPTHRHQVEHIFLCSVPEAYVPQNGPHPDKHQADIMWLSVDALTETSFSPKGLIPYIKKQINGPDQSLPEAPILAQYLGRLPA